MCYTANLELLKRLDGCSASQRIVYLAIASMADETGECRASCAKLEQLTGLKRTAIKTALRAMEASGLLQRRTRHREIQGGATRAQVSNCYYIPAENALHPHGLGPKKQVEKARQGGVSERQGVVVKRPGGVSSDDRHRNTQLEITKPNGLDGDAVDPKKLVFDSGVRLLSASGKSEGQARAIIGRWLKDHSEGDVISALGACQRAGAVEPVSYVTAALKNTRKPENDGRSRYALAGGTEAAW